MIREETTTVDQEKESPEIWSVKIKLKIDISKNKNVIEDTLTRIRAITGVTVVTSHSDAILSSEAYKVDYVNLKFANVSHNPKVQVKGILSKIKKFPYVDAAFAIKTSLHKLVD